MRSERRANVSSWVTMRNVWPNSLRRSKKRLCSSVLFCESRLPEGSSARTTSGRSHSHALLLATGELGRLVRGPVGEAQIIEQLGRPAVGFGTAAAGNECRQHDVFEGGKFGQELVKLENKADMTVAEGRELFLTQVKSRRAVEENLSGIGFFERPHDLQEGSLAGAAGTHDGDNLSLLDAGIDAFQHFEPAETFVYVLYLYHASDNWRITWAAR